MVVVIALLAFLPRVEDPWPDEISFMFPFTIAGAAGTIAQLAIGNVPTNRRDEEIRRWGRRGLFAGSAFYLASLLVQVVSLL